MHKYWRHLGDYSRKTRHLTMLEHGAYTLLLDLYYDREKPLPVCESDVLRLAGAVSRHEKKAVCSILREFFTLTEMGWVNKRADEELTHYQAKSESSRRAIESRWNNARNTDVSRTNDDGNTSRARSNNQQPATNNQSTLPSAADAAPAGESEQLLSLEGERADTSAEAEVSGAKKKKWARARNELFDAVARVCGMVPEQVTKSAGGEIGKALSEIKGVCAEVSVQEIERRAGAYRREWPQATLSPSALAKHWGRFAGGREKRGGAVLVEDTMPPVGWERGCKALYDDVVPWGLLGDGQQAEVRAWLSSEKNGRGAA